MGEGFHYPSETRFLSTYVLCQDQYFLILIIKTVVHWVSRLEAKSPLGQVSRGDVGRPHWRIFEVGQSLQAEVAASEGEVPGLEVGDCILQIDGKAPGDDAPPRSG